MHVIPGIAVAERESEAETEPLGTESRRGSYCCTCRGSFLNSQSIENGRCKMGDIHNAAALEMSLGRMGSARRKIKKI